MNEKIRIRNPYSYRIIYVLRVNDESHEGLLKIGQTELKTSIDINKLTPNCSELKDASTNRIKQYTNTIASNWQLLHCEVGRKSNGGGFTDKDVHRVLKASGIENVKPNGSTSQEWFKVNLETVKNAINAASNNQPSLTPGQQPKRVPIILRPEQREAVDMAKNRLKNAKKVRLLWNAKMRFGKTISALTLIKEMAYSKSIIITHRPVVDKSWRDDFRNVFTGQKDILFLTNDCGSIIKQIKDDKKIIYFASIQDLRGSQSVGGSFDKNNEIFSIDWDIVITDEAHEGTQTELGQNVTKELLKDKANHLALSGTPFNIENSYSSDNVYVWDYMSEQRAKHNWAATHEGDSNPYESLPEMNMFTYDLWENISGVEAYMFEEKFFNFKEFFRVWTGDEEVDQGKVERENIGKFVHEDDVKKFILLLRDDMIDTNYPFSKKDYREALKHTLWKVPGVKEAEALKDLLKQDPIFEKFGIVNVAGNDDDERLYDNALKDVEKAIKENEYTITLTCGRLTTGVTVKEWTGVLMLSGSNRISASTYLQTIFRVQSPYTDENGRMKDVCYVFDFAPDRVLEIYHEMARTCALKRKAIDEPNPRKVMEE